MKAAELAARADRLAEKTADAYSWDSYGERGWRAAIKMLLRRDYSDAQIEAVMRSKWTRWAGDQASKSDRVNSADLARLIDAQNPEAWWSEVAELVAGTFPGGVPVDEPVPVVFPSQLFPSNGPDDGGYRVQPAIIDTSDCVVTLAIHATCPKCGFDINVVPNGYEEEGYDNNHDGGRGGYRAVCQSCEFAFVIEAPAVHQIQNAALVLLGQAS